MCSVFSPSLCLSPLPEIIKLVEMTTNLLRVRSDLLEPDCLARALLVAVRSDNHFNIGKLIVKGAPNIDEALALSVQEGKPHARAMLLLVKAATRGDRNIVLQLFGDFSQRDSGELQDTGFQAAQKAVRLGKVSTVVPIEIARRHPHSAVREELLLRTNVNKSERTVYWHGLRLLELDISWLRKIPWVERLRLSGNEFKVLPEDMGLHLKQVSMFRKELGISGKMKCFLSASPSVNTAL